MKSKTTENKTIKWIILSEPQIQRMSQNILNKLQLRKNSKISRLKFIRLKLITNKSKKVIDVVKNKNETILNEIENIDTLIETIEKEYPDTSFLETFSN
jgi:hypothetical protein